ncbi:Avirulence (Avh) protein [Phytophthora megakarya]|uniref:Avirulence (Avh) protein n=1 Tax=Phytophthora megakarya TaxID=4795 RepID=A0A225X1R8_9STRA|nr:Avirulence (Avh) protein [Phytophthora megakarya]
MEIPAGRKLDLTQLKTPSGRTIDLTKVKTTSRSKMDINHLKNAAIKDPDLSSVSSLVGKNPTKLSSKEVEGVQSFLKKHPKDGLNTINLMFGGGVAALFLLLFGSALVITFQAVFTKH